MAGSDLTTFICLFHNVVRAEEAIGALEQAGFQRQAMTSVWQSGPEPATLREELGQLGVPDRDLEHLREGIASGGVVLSLDAPESQTDTVESIFHRYSADKIDETEGRTADKSPTVSQPSASSAEFKSALPLAAAVVSTHFAPGTQADSFSRGEAQSTADQIVVPRAQEDLLVGKREVDRGGVRVYRRTVTEPVRQDLTLHEESIHIDRRPVDRAATPAELAAQDQVIELHETAEVPVISKVARVVEEVHAGVVGSERTEVVAENVRHTELEIEPVLEDESQARRDRLR